MRFADPPNQENHWLCILPTQNSDEPNSAIVTLNLKSHEHAAFSRSLALALRFVPKQSRCFVERVAIRRKALLVNVRDRRINAPFGTSAGD